MTHTRYLKIFSLCSVSIFIIILMLNLLVDPYDLYRLVCLRGINAVKPEFRKYSYMSKAYAVKRLRPQALILGTSRVENGIDPRHPGWHYQPAYNLGLSGANIYEAFRYYQHAYAVQPLKEVVIGLDLLMFNGNNEQSANFTEERLLVDRYGCQQPRYYRDLLTSLISFSALSDSIDTLFRQSSTSNELFLPQGQRDPAYHYYRTRKYGGYRKRFIKSARVYLGPDSELFSPHRDRRYFIEPGVGTTTFDSYRALLRHAYGHNVSLSCFIPPLHAWYWEIIRLNDMWPLWEMWKRELVRINEEEAHTAGKEPFRLWDFSGYHVFAAEAVPPMEDVEAAMQWHWEASHYKKELGDLVLDVILGYDRAEGTVPSDFGVILNTATIESRLNHIVNQQRSYRKAAAADVDLLETLAREQTEAHRLPVPREKGGE